MEDKKIGVKDKVHPDLLIPPHIVDKLFQLLAGEWQPDNTQQEQLAAHLMECHYCRTALIIRLAAEQEDERSYSSFESSARYLFTRFVAIHHEIELQDYELFGAYAEAIVVEGQEKADRRFPRLAEHMKRCRSCKTTLEEILAFLNEPRKAD